MPTYSHLCQKCSHEWDDEYKMSEPIPSACPGCKEVGCVKRLISAAAPGKVELYGRELKEHLKAEGRKMRQEAMHDMNKLGNIVGEDRLHQNELNRTRR